MIFCCRNYGSSFGVHIKYYKTKLWGVNEVKKQAHLSLFIGVRDVTDTPFMLCFFFITCRLTTLFSRLYICMTKILKKIYYVYKEDCSA